MTASHRRPRRPYGSLALGVVALGAAAAGIVFLLPGGGKPAAKGPTTTPRASANPSTSTTSSTPSAPAPSHRAVGNPLAAASLRSYLAGLSGQVTAAVYDARTGQTWVLSGASVQDTASIVKVQIMGTALQKAEAEHRQLPPAEASLMAPMIEESDNDAATDLLADVGGPPAVLTFDRSIGMTDTQPHATLPPISGTDLPAWGLTTTTAADEVKLIAAFAFPNKILTDQSRRYGLQLMENIDPTQNWGISGGVPASGTTIALKNGWVPIPPSNLWQVDSIGWVSGHGRDYVIAVLTKGNASENDGIETIQTIAKAVYDELAPAR